MQGCSVSNIFSTTRTRAGVVVTPIQDIWAIYGMTNYLDVAYSVIEVMENNADPLVTWSNTAKSTGTGTLGSPPKSSPTITSPTIQSTQSGKISTTSQPYSTTVTTIKLTSPPPITSCSMTTAVCTAISGLSLAPASYCTCNSGWMASLGSKVGADQYTTYTCAVSGTFIPVSTVMPTNVPGKGGLPGCAAVMSVPGTSAYCNCGGTPAPTLSASGPYVINCEYTIQPTRPYNPVIPPSKTIVPASTSTNLAPLYESSQCNVHVWEGLGPEDLDPDVSLRVNITDASGKQLGHNATGVSWDETVGTDSELPWVMLVTPQKSANDKKGRSADIWFLPKLIGDRDQSLRPLYDKGPVKFAYSGQAWDTGSSRCSVGDWDHSDYLINRQMDGKFTCP